MTKGALIGFVIGVIAAVLHLSKVFRYDLPLYLTFLGIGKLSPCSGTHCAYYWLGILISCLVWALLGALIAYGFAGSLSQDDIPDHKP